MKLTTIRARCAGLDVHKDTVVATIHIAEGPGEPTLTTRTFGTTTPDLLGLADWLTENRVTHAVMESTGVYWRPVWNILEGAVDLTLANAAHVKNVPGRKSDVNDSQWLSVLAAHGLVENSYVPAEDTQVIRDLTRTRSQLARESTRHVQRIQKTLEAGNIKLSSVLTDVMGKSGRAIIDAIVAGEKNPNLFLKHVDSRVRASREDIKKALTGRVREHHRLELKIHLKLYDELEASMKEVEQRIGELLETFQEIVNRLTMIPGIKETTARVILGEIGHDVSRFPTAGHLVSWAGLCPRSDESAGRRRNTRIKKGSQWLKTQLVQAATAAARTRNSYFHAMHKRITARRGYAKAIIAVANAMLTTKADAPLITDST
jgi:transposase